jgi:hypothetical protein
MTLKPRTTTMRALRDDERTHAAAIVAVWLVENAVQVTADYPTGTNWVPVAIDDEARRLGVLVQAPGTASSLAEIPMLAVA